MQLTRFSALAAVLAGFAFSGCSSSPDTAAQGKGNSSVDFKLRTAGGIVVTSVNYDLDTSTGQDVLDGTIPVPNDNSVINGTIPSLLPGSYSLDLSATATYNGQNISCEADAASFTLADSQNLVLPTAIALTCTYTSTTADSSGRVTFTADVVPNEIVEVARIVETFGVTPYSVTGVAGSAAGSCDFPPINVKVANANPAISYSWSAPSGDFALNASNTEGTYTCDAFGSTTLTVTATLNGASASVNVPVDCNPGTCVNTCGDGVVQAGEECDESTPRCTACEITPVCGDAVIDAPEVCEASIPVSGGTCAPDCLSIIPDGTGGTGGGGTGGTGGAGEGGGGTSGGGTGGTGPTAQWDSCEPCMRGNAAIPFADACDPLAGCEAVAECAVNTGCYSVLPASCYCGTTDIEVCRGATFEPTGQCEDQIRAGATGSTTNAEIVDNLYLFETATGNAMLLLTVATQPDSADGGPFCIDECAPGLVTP